MVIYGALRWPNCYLEAASIGLLSLVKKFAPFSAQYSIGL
ncbi:hypothetical protein NC652_037562 [Populus alba x Populus x berolinensis]|nr:hypothetical protein NC652_037562 [Populus alba x Populus x berolinensis]